MLHTTAQLVTSFHKATTAWRYDASLADGSERSHTPLSDQQTLIQSALQRQRRLIILCHRRCRTIDSLPEAIVAHTAVEHRLSGGRQQKGQFVRPLVR